MKIAEFLKINVDGKFYKKVIFEEHIHEGLVGRARMAKKNKRLRKASNGSTTTTILLLRVLLLMHLAI